MDNQVRVNTEGVFVTLQYGSDKVGVGYADVIDGYAAARPLWRAVECFEAGQAPGALRTVKAGPFVLQLLGATVRFVYNDKLWFACPAYAAKAILQQMYNKAKELEQLTPKVMERTIEDQTLLLQSGFGLQLHPDHRVVKEAARHLPGAGNIRGGLVGFPRITCK